MRAMLAALAGMGRAMITPWGLTITRRRPRGMVIIPWQQCTHVDDMDALMARARLLLLVPGLRLATIMDSGMRARVHWRRLPAFDVDLDGPDWLGEGGGEPSAGGPGGAPVGRQP